MNFYRILCYIFIMMLSVCKCQSQIDPLEMLRITKKKYCGENLSKTLSTVCRGHYNTLSKKSDVIEKKGYWAPSYNSELEEASYPFTRKSRAVSMMANYQRRRKRGVYNECCEKPCSHKELSNYCAH